MKLSTRVLIPSILTAGALQAATVSFVADPVDEIPLVTEIPSLTFGLPGFDPELGDLEQATVTLNAQFAGTGQPSNLLQFPTVGAVTAALGGTLTANAANPGIIDGTPEFAAIQPRTEVFLIPFGTDIVPISASTELEVELSDLDTIASADQILFDVDLTGGILTQPFGASFAEGTIGLAIEYTFSEDGAGGDTDGGDEDTPPVIPDIVEDTPPPILPEPTIPPVTPDPSTPPVAVIPLPASLPLLAGGLLLFGLIRRFRG